MEDEEALNDMKALHGMDVEAEIAQILSEEIAKETYKEQSEAQIVTDVENGYTLTEAIDKHIIESIKEMMTESDFDKAMEVLDE